MSDLEPGAQDVPRGAGGALRVRREQQGLDLADVAQRTRVPLRHLEAIEAGDYARLPSVTYAVGFARAYARAVGADEVAVAADVRREVDRIGRTRPEYEPYVTADPARVPSRGVAIVSLGLALAVVVLAALYFTTDLFRPGAPGTGGAVVASVPQASPAATPTPTPTPAPTPAGQVALVANDEVWVRVSDAADRTLKLGTMQAGERYEVPRDSDGPRLTVGRPDKLTVSLDGRTLPSLGDGARPVRGVVLTAAALDARLSGPAGAASGNRSSEAPRAAPLVSPVEAAPVEPTVARPQGQAPAQVPGA